MGAFSSFVIVFTMLVADLTRSVSGLDCYDCNSITHPGCEDPFHKKTAHIKTCDIDYTGAKTSGCIKMVLPDGEVTRGCASYKSPSEIVRQCKHKNTTICPLCTTNRCNSSEKLEAFSIIIMLQISIFVIFTFRNICC